MLDLFITELIREHTTVKIHTFCVPTLIVRQTAQGVNSGSPLSILFVFFELPPFFYSCVFVCTRARACIKKTELPHATSFDLQSIAAFVFADLHNIPIYGDVAPLHLSPLIEGPETGGCDASHNHRVEVSAGR